MIYRSRLRLLASLCLAAICGSAGSAQDAQPDGPTADLVVAIGPDETATLQLSGLRGAVDLLALEPALDEVLRRPLQDVRVYSDQSGWNLRGRCANVLTRRGLAHEVDLNVTPLLAALRPSVLLYLRVTVHPPVGVVSELPGGTRTLVFRSYLGPLFIHSYTLRTDAPEPPKRLVVGYREVDLLRYVPLAALLLGATGLTWRRRQAGLRIPDACAAWFHQRLYDRSLGVTIWCLWLVAVPSLGVGQVTGYLVNGLHGTYLISLTAGGALVAWTAALVLPLAVTLVVCKGLAAPVFARVPEAGWTVGRVWGQAWWGQVLVVAPLLFAAGCCEASLRPSDTSAPRLFVGGLVVAVLAGGYWAQTRSYFPWRGEPFGLQVARRTGLVFDPPRNQCVFYHWKGTRPKLPPGGLRDRISEFAEKANVKVAQIYCLTKPQWRLVNAFQTPADLIYFERTALAHLSRREADALAAHEVALWWWWVYRGWLYASLRWVIGLGLIWLARLVARMEVYADGWPVLGAAALVAVALLVLHLWRNPYRFGGWLDAEAATQAGDPEALVAALAKLWQLGLLPLSGDPDEIRTLPLLVDWQRLRRLAERFDIPADRLQEIVDGASAGQETYPPHGSDDADSSATTRPTSAAFNKQTEWLCSETLLLAMLLPPLLAALLVEWTGWQGPIRWGLYLLGTSAAVGLYLRLIDVRGGRGFAELSRHLAAQLEAEGIRVGAWGGVFVGLVPGDRPQLFEGFYNWDVCYLFLQGDRLCYVGGQARFGLRRDQVTALRVDRGGPGWHRAKGVYLTWRAGDRGGTFHLRPGEGARVSDGARQLPVLAARLKEWRRSTEAAAVEETLAALPPPELPVVGGQSPKVLVNPSRLVSHFGLIAGLAALMAWLVGLPFDPWHGGTAWYAIGSTLFLGAFSFWPFWRYREPAPKARAEDEQ